MCMYVCELALFSDSFPFCSRHLLAMNWRIALLSCFPVTFWLFKSEMRITFTQLVLLVCSSTREAWIVPLVKWAEFLMSSARMAGKMWRKREYALQVHSNIDLRVYYFWMQWGDYWCYINWDDDINYLREPWAGYCHAGSWEWPSPYLHTQSPPSHQITPPSWACCPASSPNAAIEWLCCPLWWVMWKTYLKLELSWAE